MHYPTLIYAYNMSGYSFAENWKNKRRFTSQVICLKNQLYSTASQLEEIECSPKTSSTIHPGRLKQMSSTQPNAVIMSPIHMRWTLPSYIRSRNICLTSQVPVWQRGLWQVELQKVYIKYTQNGNWLKSTHTDLYLRMFHHQLPFLNEGRLVPDTTKKY